MPRKDPPPVTLPPSSLKRLQELVSLCAPSGYETPVQDLFARTLKGIADELHCDPYGNTWAVLNPPRGIKNAPLVMISGHGDEIGLMVKHIEESGLLRVTAIGGVDPKILPSRRVRILTRKGPILGVIGATAIHLQDRNEQPKPQKMEELYVDCGFQSREEAIQLTPVGTPMVVAEDFLLLRNNRAIGRALDNRIGVFTAMEVFQRVARKRNELKVRLVALSTVQEEIGGAGALVVTRTINPDLAFVVDVTHATDTPGISKERFGNVQLGKGPTITHGSVNHPILVDHIKEVARRLRIPLQEEAADRYTGTDTDYIMRSTRGIPSALVSLPNRYMHTPAEMIDLSDLEYLSRLLSSAILLLKDVERFRTPIPSLSR